MQSMKMATNTPAKFTEYLAAGTVLYLCLFLFSPPLFAETVEVILPGNITAIANYHGGSASLPAVLLVHGFLQTGHSPPMSSLASNLASKGYSVLNPTISLSIQKRVQSMPCESAHTHTMAGDVAEVAYWVNWLNSKGHKDIVLAGFSSTANHAILLYNAQGTPTNIRHAVLTSLNPIYTEQIEYQKTLNSINTKQGKAPGTLNKYSLGFCKKNFVATPPSYLSYAIHDAAKVLELLKHTPVHTDVILGSADTVLPVNWADRIRAQQSHVQVRIIENAMHFMDGTHEFDLAEEVESILKQIQTR